MPARSIPAIAMRWWRVSWPERTGIGSGGGAVEVDETYIGVLKGQPIRQSGAHKMKVISLVDRTSGQIRS